MKKTRIRVKMPKLIASSSLVIAIKTKSGSSKITKDRDQLIIDRDQDKLEAFVFVGDRDQHHLLIAIKVGQN